jgi:hypothetical protein
MSGAQFVLAFVPGARTFALAGKKTALSLAK